MEHCAIMCSDCQRKRVYQQMNNTYSRSCGGTLLSEVRKAWGDDHSDTVHSEGNLSVKTSKEEETFTKLWGTHTAGMLKTHAWEEWTREGESRSSPENEGLVYYTCSLIFRIYKSFWVVPWLTGDSLRDINRVMAWANMCFKISDSVDYRATMLEVGRLVTRVWE